MPADARVDDRRARTFDGLRELHDLVPVAAVRDEVEHRQPVHEDEIGPDRFARARDDLDRQPHAVGVAAAPRVVATVHVLDQELVDEVPLRSHDLDAVVAGFARQHGAAHECADLSFDAARTQSRAA